MEIQVSLWGYSFTIYGEVGDKLYETWHIDEKEAIDKWYWTINYSMRFFARHRILQEEGCITIFAPLVMMVHKGC
jgi:hypothetical protein